MPFLDSLALLAAQAAPVATSAVVAAPAAKPSGAEHNPVAIACFFLFVAVTLVVTYIAAKKTKTVSHFYTGGGGLTGWQNGLALAGDYMSAASFLGIVGMVSLQGFDGLIYSIGFLVGWPIMMFTIAEPLRNLGKFTFADVVAFRLRQKPVRLASAVGTLSVVIFYLIAQMVGAGQLIKLLFGISFEWSVVIVGIAMMGYVFFGGMAATSWVQIIKAVLLLGGAFAMSVMVLSKFGYNPLALFQAAAEKAMNSEKPVNVLGPVKLVTGSPDAMKNALDAVSLGLALMFGTSGLPHILMRFYTVPDSKTARSSVTVATGFIGFFYLMTFILGFGALTLVGQKEIIANTSNMAAPMLAQTLGGNAFFGFIAAVAFATILAVVAGLTLSGASALSHDLWVNALRGGHADDKEQLLVARIATVALGIIGITLGIAFKSQNVAFMVGLAFAIAASANFPALFLSMLWKRFTTSGAVACMVTGAASALILIYLSPVVAIDVLKHKEAAFPLKNPALISIPLSFAVGIIVSLLTPDREAEAKFAEVERRIHFGE